MVIDKQNQIQYSTLIDTEDIDIVGETSGTIDEGGDDEEKSGTIDGFAEDEEKSGTIDEFGEYEENSGTIDGCGEEEVQSGISFKFEEDVQSSRREGCDGDETQSFTFAKINEDEYRCDSLGGSNASSSDISFSGNIEKQLILTLKGTNTTSESHECIRVGQIYDSKTELQLKLRMITIFQNFDYTTSKSTKTLLVLKCFVPGCSWRIRASTFKRTFQFKVRKYIDIHTCSVIKRSSRHRQATSKCFGELYLAKFGKVGMGIRPMHIMDVMKAMYGIDIDYWKAYDALVHAREMVRGTWESGYAYLPSYLHRIETANPGTITRLECDEKDRFRYLFIAFGACINGFQFIKNVVVVDGTHLKGKFKDILLVAVGQDENGRIFPLTFGIVDSENDVAWEWFLFQLCMVCVDHQDLVIISDRHKSIGILNLVKKAMRVYRIFEFTSMFNDIRLEKSDLATYLENADVRLWSRANFPGNSYGILTSNIAESLNNVLINARGYPLACFLEELRKLISKWFMRRRERDMSLQTFFTPKVEKTLERRAIIGNTLNVQHIYAHRSHVTGGELSCVVDLQQMHCTCRVYDIDKIPCEHALAASTKRRNVRLETIVHPYYTKSHWYNAYADSINPDDVELETPADITNRKCLPPKEKRGVGRPKKSRYLSALEKAMGKQPRRRKVKIEKLSQEQPIQTLRKLYKCSQCKQGGHNRATCQNV